MKYRCVLLASIILTTSKMAQASDCNPNGYPISDNDYNHTAWINTELEDGDRLFERAGFVASFDGEDDDDNDPTTQNLLGVPEWVAHEIRRYSEDGDFIYASGYKRPRPWYEHPGLGFLSNQPGVTNDNVDDSYSGEAHIWNRGHLATRSLVNRVSPEAGCNSHYFFNAFPQYNPLNTGVWLALERYTGAAANKYGKAWAINGPIFYPGQEIETVGKSGEIPIAIPHALFKIIIFEIEEEIFVRAYRFEQPEYARVKTIMQNNGNQVPRMNWRSCSQTDQYAFDFDSFSTSISEIEKLTGIEFFPDMEASEKSQLNDFSDNSIWKIDLKYFADPCG